MRTACMRPIRMGWSFPRVSYAASPHGCCYFRHFRHFPPSSCSYLVMSVSVCTHLTGHTVSQSVKKRKCAHTSPLRAAVSKVYRCVCAFATPWSLELPYGSNLSQPLSRKSEDISQQFSLLRRVVRLRTCEPHLCLQRDWRYGFAP